MLAFLGLKNKMTKLLDPRKTKKIELPSFPDSEVELYDGLLTDQIGTLTKNDNDYDRGIEVLKALIKSWSFVDENEKSLAVSKETLGKLPAKDFMFLMDAAMGSLDFLDNKKRKS